MSEINPYKALDFMRDHAEEYAIAKAQVVYLTEYRKSLKAMLMSASTEKTESAKETYAYSHDTYREHLKALADAVTESERLRWLLIAAQAKLDVWRSLESSARAEGRSTT